MTNEVENEIQTSTRYRTLLRSDGASAAPTGPNAVDFALQRFQDKKVWIAFGGHFNAGKSTLQNSLLGQDLLPSNDKPETGIACFVCAGDRDHAVAINREGNQAKIECSAAAIAAVSTLLDPITGEHKAESARALAVQVTVAISSIPQGVCWVDTPGINDTGDMDARARSALDGADLVIWVLNSQQLLSEVEQRFLADYVAEHGTRSIVFVVNVFLRADSEPEWYQYIAESQPAILDKIERFFRGLQPEGQPDRPLIFTTSARAVRSQPDRFDPEGLIPLIRGNASFWERVWLARSERLTMAITRQQSEEKQEAAARLSATSLVRSTELQRSSPLLAEARKAFDRKQFPEMLLNAAAAADQAPSESEPHVLRSIGLIFSGQFQFAVFAAECALRINPKNEEAFLARGWARVQLNESEQALEDLRRFLDSSEAIGWRRTVALWLKARCTYKEDLGSAICNLRDASDDTLGLARLGLTSAALIFVATQLLETVGEWEDALDGYREGMMAAVSIEDGELLKSFEIVSQAFSINKISGPVMFSLARKAWDVCKRLADGRGAAELFVDQIMSSFDTNTNVFHVDLFRDDQSFFLYMASAFAKLDQPDRTLMLLRTLLDMDPGYDIKLAKKDQYIGASISADLVQFLKFSFTYEWKAGTLVNYITVKNTSAFRITNAVVFVYVTRSNGVADPVINFPSNDLDSQGKQTFYDVFSNPGMFGTNISKVEVRMSCSEWK